MKKFVCAALAGALCFVSFASCNNVKQGNVDYSDKGESVIVKEITDAEKGVIKNVTNGGFTVNSVNESAESSRVANKKFELDIDAEFEGNPYDPDEINVYGEFLSPTGKIYEMPAFYYEDYNREFRPLDETADYSMNGYVEQGQVKLRGRIDEIDGVKKPVAKASFYSEKGVYSNAGAVLDTSGVNVRQNVVTVWLKKSADFTAEHLYLCFYQSKGESFIEVKGLTEEWQKFTFNYGDFTANNADGSKELLSMSKMYSGYLQTRGSAVSGDVYISDLRFCREGFENNYAQLSTFVSEELKNYRSGELNGKEIIESTGKENFKLRFRFDTAGVWNYKVTAKKDGKTASEYYSSVTVTENPSKEENKGLIRVEQTRKRNFVFENGEPYVAIGQNVAYSVDPERGSYDYDVYFPRMKAAGMNFCRIWLTYIGYGSESTEGGILGFGNRQNKAYVFDRLLEEAANYGFYLQVPLMTFSRFHSESAEDDVEWRSWDSSPFNVINGGYLKEAHEFYTDARAKEDTKKLYRYYVARYGYSRNILNWEIMNEIGESSDYDQQVAKAWAEEIGGYMHAVDPFNHLVSTSSVQFFDEVYSAKSLDFVSIHSYIWGAQYAVNAADVTAQVQERFNKPVIIGEIGASSVSEDYNLMADPTGAVMRQTAFTAPMSGSAGGGMLWWWQQINNNDFYKNVTPAINYFKLLDKKFVTMKNIGTAYKFNHSSATVVSNCRLLGFCDDTSVYAYLFDTRYSYANLNPGAISGATLTFNIGNGNYTVKVFDTREGKVTREYDAESKNGELVLTVDDFSGDIAFIIDKK